MPANLRDVAAVADVSVPTASRVLSGSAYPVADELRARVLKAAEELDYVPNAQARALLVGSSATVGVLAGDVGDPYFSLIIDGVQDVATGARVLVTICTTGRDIDRELEYFGLLQSHRVGAVIIAGSTLAEERYAAGLRKRVASYLAGGGRVVAIGQPDLGVDRVLVTNAKGATALGRHLVDLGHRRVGILAGLRTLASTIQRIDGIRAAVEGAGGSVVVLHGAATREGGERGVRELLATNPAVTAVVGTADQMAVGAMHALSEQGISVPDEISVAGFNDIPAGLDVTPNLTTVQLPLREMGAQAARYALESSRTPRSRTLHTRLLVRGSTAVPRG
ncbi:hypothetical protein N802_05570 [Knoellia sinensis KCTC 19936]|uniref:HTH lacI-type domain-containing protein n=1 Tax=Knoellia sinensis KCTC 19936 TaxID=1385520 RepID=A0A0A0J2E4_9MICO|nr:LacI family DNA-binding transcriptional regulator [Knoellia sinensis]KGN30864.1 hypothetical protein N802_05570 [Knoellia sinensis KCTC 19936]